MEPDRVAGFQQALERGELGDQSAAGCDNRASPRAHDALQRAALIPAVGGLPEKIEDPVDAEIRLALDLAAEFDEIPAKTLGQQRAERALAGAAQADERDPGRARRTV